jgi:hypothetical protein
MPLLTCDWLTRVAGPGRIGLRYLVHLAPVRYREKKPFPFLFLCPILVPRSQQINNTEKEAP